MNPNIIGYLATERMTGLLADAALSRRRQTGRLRETGIQSATPSTWLAMARSQDRLMSRRFLVKMKPLLIVGHRSGPGTG
jgi:hypothetical protein